MFMPGKDKGGPSKGGFLNNRLLSYAVLCSCNETNGVYTHTRLFMSICDYSGNHLYEDHLCLAPVLLTRLCFIVCVLLYEGIHMCVYMYICIYIYIYRERESERDKHCIFIYTYT